MGLFSRDRHERICGVRAGADAEEPGFIGGLCSFLPDGQAQIWLKDEMGEMSREYLVHELAHGIVGELPQSTGHTFEWRRFYLLAYAHCLDRDPRDIKGRAEHIVGYYRERNCARRERLGKHIDCPECHTEVRAEVEEHLAAIRDYPVVAQLSAGDAVPYEGMRLALAQIGDRKTVLADVLGIGLCNLRDERHALTRVLRPIRRLDDLCNDPNLSECIRRVELYDNTGETKLAVLEKDDEERRWLLES